MSHIPSDQRHGAYRIGYGRGIIVGAFRSLSFNFGESSLPQFIWQGFHQALQHLPQMKAELSPEIVCSLIEQAATQCGIWKAICEENPQDLLRRLAWGPETSSDAVDDPEPQGKYRSPTWEEEDSSASALRQILQFAVGGGRRGVSGFRVRVGKAFASAPLLAPWFRLGRILGAEAAGIPMEVLHRVAAMAGGGMDTLPHNGAVITLLTVTGLTHRDSYPDIFAITLIKTAAVFVAIAAYRLTGLV